MTGDALTRKDKATKDINIIIIIVVVIVIGEGLHARYPARMIWQARRRGVAGDDDYYDAAKDDDDDDFDSSLWSVFFTSSFVFFAAHVTHNSKTKTTTGTR